MQTYVFEGRVTALSAIAHNGGQSSGTLARFRREKIILPDGDAVEIPMLSGNGIRGMLRDTGMLHMCQQLGYSTTPNGDVIGMPLAAFYFLFSGGSLSATAGRGIDVDEARKVRSLIPLVGVFGGAMGNQIMPGKLTIGKMIPLGAETNHLVPEPFRNRSQSVYGLLQEEMYTRKDDAKDERKRPLIESSARHALDDERRAKALRKSEPVEQTGTAQQMMYHVETLAAGTQFYWKVTLSDVSPVEFDAFATTLAVWSRHPFVGGKSNVGLGEVAVQFESWMSIDSRVQVPATAIDVPLGQHYDEHLRTRREDIRAFLESLR